MRRASQIFFSVVLASVFISGCASQKNCKARADAQYRECVNPQYFPEGEPHAVTRGDEALECQQAHHQAIAQCDGETYTPLGPTLTSTQTEQ